MPKHKAQQLAAQVRRALDHALMTLCDDEILENVSVDTVTPTPDESRMTVVFVAHGDAMTLGREAVTARLEAARPEFMRHTTEAISRKRPPELVITVTPESALQQPE